MIIEISKTQHLCKLTNITMEINAATNHRTVVESSVTWVDITIYTRTVKRERKS